MSDQDKSPWERILDEISSPWDWAAATVGGAAGAVVTMFAQGTDLGTFISAGAIIGVAARKAVYVSLQSRRLGKRYFGLKEELQERLQNSENADVRLLMQ